MLSMKSRWIKYTYHPFNDSLSERFACDTHCTIEHGHADNIVPSCNNIIMAMTTNKNLLSFCSTMKKHADILRSITNWADDMDMFGHCNQTNDQAIDA